MMRQASWTKPRKLWAWYSQRMRIRRCHWIQAKKPPRGPNRHRELAAPLQHDQAALPWIQATSTGGVRARLRRVAGCATPSGSAGHADETANLKLTFHLDTQQGLIILACVATWSASDLPRPIRD